MVCKRSSELMEMILGFFLGGVPHPVIVGNH